MYVHIYISFPPQADTGADSNADDEEHGDTDGVIFKWPGEEGSDDDADDDLEIVVKHFGRNEGEGEIEGEVEGEVEEDDYEYSYEAATAAAYREEEERAQLYGDIYDEAMKDERRQFDLLVHRNGHVLPPTNSGRHPRARGSNSRSEEESDECESDEYESDESDAEADRFVRDSVRHHLRPGRSSGRRRARSRPDTVIAGFSEEESDKVRYVRMCF